MLSEEADYCHSFYADLIIRHLAGIEPADNGLFFHPLHTERAYFSLRNLQVRGHAVDVYFQREAGARYESLQEGYTVFVDGKERFQGYTQEAVLLIAYP